MNLFVREGILYFLAYVPISLFLSPFIPERQKKKLTMTFRDSIQLQNFINILYVFGKLPTAGWGWIMVTILEYVPLFALAPRFVLNMRELYAHNVRGNHASGIDTAFGLPSDAVGTAIVFADAGQEQNESGEHVEEISMEENRRDTNVI